ncbi:MAG: MarR family transcriptional regulator [Dehalococcoidales bacterium]|nr:MarR family transcriptional regulator [Dehalococcoidales bacterium]
MKDIVEINEEDPVLRTFILFTQTARISAKYQDAYMNRKTGLSDVKLIVLMAFFYDPTTSITPSQIARWTDTDPHNVTTLVNRMKREGLLETRRDDKDRRFLRISITEKGRASLKESMPAAQQVIDHLMASLSRDDILMMEKSLKVIRHNAYEGLASLTENK